jgi:glycosyltransferase involved in cell wall biosynthesis
MNGRTLEIMMPFYGRVDHFREAVESVLAQSDPDWRLVIVDDLYPDPEPGEWARGLGDPRIHYRRNERNLGVTGNFRECVRLAEHERVVIMGGDDRMHRGFVARVAELAAQFPDASLIQPGVDVIDGEGRIYRPLPDRVKDLARFRGHGPRCYGGEPLAASLLRGNWAYFPSLVWRLDDLRRHDFRPEFEVVEDLALILEILLDGGTFVVDDEVCFSYRRHRGSVSAQRGPDGAKFLEERALFDEMAVRMRAIGWTRAARAARLHLTSRLNAASELPGALRARDAAGARTLLTHLTAP